MALASKLRQRPSEIRASNIAKAIYPIPTRRLRILRASGIDRAAGSDTNTPHPHLGSIEMSHAANFLGEVIETAKRLQPEAIEALCDELARLRDREGRLFIIGVGGSAGNSGHAVNDFRKLCGIEAYAPTDNVSELTARTNDEGWSTVFSEWLKVSRANDKDALLVFSVGGGNLEKNVSPNIVSAVQESKKRGLNVLGIVGRDGGYTKQVGDVVVVIPTIEESRVTPHAEAFQAVIWHCLVSHPKLQRNATKW
jgi:D-sedoheptulose 7-phosphate isomerase